MLEKLPLLIDYAGYITTIATVVVFLLGVYYVFSGFIPVLWRLGKGLTGKRIAILASGQVLSSLQNSISDTKLFRDKNIIPVQSAAELGRMEKCDIFLVHWKPWADNITDVLAKKRDNCALIIYAPYEDGRIDDEVMKELERHRNVVVNNFRGRLLNDLVVSLITSGYE